MFRKPTFLVTAILSLTASLCATETMESQSTSDWSFNVSPYLWVAAVKVETTLDSEPTPPSGPGNPSTPDRFETKLGGGALLAGSVHYKSVGLWVDFVWVQTDTSAVQPGPLYSGMDLETNFFHSTVALSYILPTASNLHIEALAGVRYWSVDATITAQAGALPAFTAGQKETWTTPVIGVDFTYDLGSKWSLTGKGTVAVGDNNSDGWEVMGGVIYRFGDTWSATLAYRYLKEEYTRQRFAYSTEVSGVILGVSCRF